MSSQSIAALVAGAMLAAVICTRASAQGYGQPASTTEGKQVEPLTEKMRADPALMEWINTLQSDPEFEKAMEDPGVQAALQSGNTEALLANPTINSLVNHPTVQAITKKITQ